MIIIIFALSVLLRVEYECPSYILVSYRHLWLHIFLTNITFIQIDFDLYVRLLRIVLHRRALRHLSQGP